MITRLSKIARLPAHIREELNHRLHNGELSRTILPWVNESPETKRVMAELFHGKPITHQNLSEWRHTGYQDWLLHQQRLEWNGRLAEEEAEVTGQNRCEDGYEAMGFQFLYEISQALKAMQQIKNPNQRWDRLEALTREFSRLQNAFNWSRRVGLEFDKFKLTHPCNNTVESEPASNAVVIPMRPTLGAPASRRQELETQTSEASPPDASSFRILPSALPVESGAGIPACGSSGLASPEPNSASADLNSSTPKLLNSQTSASTPELPSFSTPTSFQSLPPLAPPTPPPRIPTPNSYLRTSGPPTRRRFKCIEG